MRSLEQRVAALEKRCETHEEIEQYYVDLIKDCVEYKVKVAVAEAMQPRVKMTIADIEEALGHKIEIIREE